MLYVGYLIVMITLIMYARPFISGMFILFLVWQIVSSGWYQWLV